MKTSKILVLAASSVLGLAFAQPADAAISYKYVTNQSVFTNAQPGSTITLNVYLNETVTAPSTSILQASNENGLFGAGFAVNELASGLASPTIISAITANADSPSQQFNGGAFNVTSVSAAGNLGTLSESTSFSNTQGVQLGNQPALAGGVTTPSNDIFLGTVTLTVGTSPGTTVFDLGVFGSSGTTVTYNDSDDLDVSGVDVGTGQSYTGVGGTVSPISVTVAPEPASLGLLGLGSLGLLARRRRLA